MRHALSNALIFKVNQLGDNVVFLPVVQELVKRSIFEQITLWTSPTAAALYGNLKPKVRTEAWPREAFNSAWKHPARLLKLWGRARANRPQFCLVGEDQGNTAHLLALLSGARMRFGTPLPHIQIPFGITNYVKWSPLTPAVEQSWALGTALAQSAGATDWPAKPPAPDLSHLVDRNSRKRFDFLIHPGASLEYKRWLPSRYEELARRLAKNHSVGWVHALPELPDFSGTGIDVLEPSDLSEFITTLAHSTVFIGNNSGPMNLASALGVPSLIFSGPSSAVWNPYWNTDRIRLLQDKSLPCIACDPPTRPLNRCLNAAQPLACMKSWTVDRVEHIALDWQITAATMPAIVA